MTKPISEMTNEEFHEFVVQKCLEGWIPLKTYIRIFPEETKSAIETRIKRKYWSRGIHYVVPEGSHMWVNLNAIRQWVLAQEPTGPGLDQ